MVAHSMGNYVLQKAAQVAWTRKNQPLLVSLLNQLLMVAADVDNDLFKSGETVDKSDGDALANLTYRITALYTGLDQVLGLSAGLKHFGKRRLGRSGLDLSVAEPDNVWEVDCTPFFQADHVGGFDAHGAYFDEPQTLDLMRQVLRGVDRSILTAGKGLVSSALASAPAPVPVTAPPNKAS
jgi:esterase/lipase superfamily enzyme